MNFLNYPWILILLFFILVKLKKNNILFFVFLISHVVYFVNIQDQNQDDFEEEDE